MQYFQCLSDRALNCILFLPGIQMKKLGRMRRGNHKCIVKCERKWYDNLNINESDETDGGML